MARAVLAGSIAYHENVALLVDALDAGGEAFRGIAPGAPKIDTGVLIKLKAFEVWKDRCNPRHPHALDLDGLVQFGPKLKELELRAKSLLAIQDQFDAHAVAFRSMGVVVTVDHLARFAPGQPFQSWAFLTRWRTVGSMSRLRRLSGGMRYPTHMRALHCDGF